MGDRVVNAVIYYKKAGDDELMRLPVKASSEADDFEMRRYLVEKRPGARFMKWEVVAMLLVTMVLMGCAGRRDGWHRVDYDMWRVDSSIPVPLVMTSCCGRLVPEAHAKWKWHPNGGLGYRYVECRKGYGCRRTTPVYGVKRRRGCHE